MKFIKSGFFLKVVIPAVAVLMLARAMFGISENPKRDVLPTLNPVPTSIYKTNISGVGITEPKNEAIEIGTNISGIVSGVYVEAGDKIEKGDKLFVIDDREAIASFELRESEYVSAKLDAAEKRAEFEMYRSISDKRAYSKDEFNKKEVASHIAAQRVKQADARAELAAVIVDKSTIRSPIDGEVLKVNISEGEFAQAGYLKTPLLVIGDVSEMHVRVEIDEMDAHLISSDKEASAYLRGSPDLKIPLTFVRIEPKVVPKVSISGAGAQKIDSRVLQVIYSFENIFEIRVLVGQQMDVYIENDEVEELGKYKEIFPFPDKTEPFPFKKADNGVADKIVTAQLVVTNLFQAMGSKAIIKN